MKYDWKKTALKALKTGLVAAVAYFLATPDLGGEILKIIPPGWQGTAVVLIPMAITALRNWVKNA